MPRCSKLSEQLLLDEKLIFASERSFKLRSIYGVTNKSAATHQYCDRILHEENLDQETLGFVFWCQLVHPKMKLSCLLGPMMAPHGKTGSVQNVQRVPR